jgi:tyrosine-protein kinase Etk/Wzc
MIEAEVQTSQPPASSQGEVILEERSIAPGMAVMSFLTELARQKKLVAIATGIGALLGVVYTLCLPTLYTATTSIMPPQQTQSAATLLMSQLASSGAGSLAAAAAGGGFGLKDPNAIYIGLLKSRPVADAIIDKLELAKVYRSRDRTDARLELEKDTMIVSERSGMISISATDRDRNRAAEIANAYTEQLRLLSKTISVTEASKRRLFFEEQMKQAKDDLSAAETALQNIQQAHGLVHLDAQASAMITSLARLHGEIEYKRVQLQSLRSFSTDQNPNVQLAERELAALESEAAQMEHNGSSKNFSDMGLKDVPQAGLDYVRAQREFTYRQMFFDLLFRQYEAARLDEAKDATVIQVVEAAVPPERKSSPQRVSETLMFALLGFLAACARIFLARFAKRNVELVQSFSELKLAIAGK